MIFSTKTFGELTTDELYEILALRQRVFCVEQNCPYLDCDGLDRAAVHLMGWADGRLIAYARIFAPGDKYDETGIGRIVTSPEVRATGRGRQLVEVAIRVASERYGRRAIRIGAQRRLERFYASFGFAPSGEPYDEDGIPHIEMLRA